MADDIECLYYAICGGLCETDVEVESGLCTSCMLDEIAEDHSRVIAERFAAAMQRIAIAAGIELATPEEVADIACRKMMAPTQPNCKTCANRGVVDGLSDESHCDHCSHQETWRTSHYAPNTELKGASESGSTK